MEIIQEEICPGRAAVLCSLRSLCEGMVRRGEETAVYCGMSLPSISF